MIEGQRVNITWENELFTAKAIKHLSVGSNKSWYMILDLESKLFDVKRCALFKSAQKVFKRHLFLEMMTHPL